MTKLIKKYCTNEFAFPIDIDEFIVLYNKNTNTINCDNIINYLHQLPLMAIYKTNYIQSKVLSAEGYDSAVYEAKFGQYDDRGPSAKTFIHSSHFNGTIDHGNHLHTHNYMFTDLCLVHYHYRNLEQMLKKIYNNVKGFNYPVFNINGLNKILLNNPQCNGNHHIINQISVLRKTFKLPISTVDLTDISLLPISAKMNSFDSEKNRLI